MAKRGTLDLASGLGGKLTKQQVDSAVDQYFPYGSFNEARLSSSSLRQGDIQLFRYVNYHELHGGEEESRKSSYTELVNKYYDLVTSFYEYGWGDSFHFAGRWHGETLRESIKRHQHFIALQLGLKEGMKVLDVGCGIGGPLVEIARFSSTLITGLNNNDYQISRGQEFILSVGLSEKCNFLKGDFMDMPISDNSFDAAYSLQATCHAPDALGVHRTIKAEIELGDGLPDIRTTRQCIQAMKDAGFEVIFAKDLAADFPCPWYQPMDPSHISWTSFQCTRVGHFITRTIVSTLEFLRIAPAGSMRVYNFLRTASEGLLKGGREGIFTANFFILGRKPALETGTANGDL
ncbi:hypothetical protein QOZ80_3BG0256680 [Eleusine coracana subsp. coracana]|nr:hypothetical protein QOZ80_3BG0256680 [Eleusine coracana subsp. coracana]